jgi:hypothetical protein
MFVSLKILTLTVAASLAVVALTGCESENNINGTVVTNTTINVVNSKGKVVRLAAGRYKAKVKMEKKGGSLIISSGASKLQVALPVLGTSSNINLSAGQIKQEFGLNGSIYNTRSPFDRSFDTSCVYDTQTKYACSRNAEGEQVCDWENVDIPGTERRRETGYSMIKTSILT